MAAEVDLMLLMRRFVVFALLSCLVALSVQAQRKRRVVGGEPAVATTTLDASAQDVFEALRQALADWRIRKADVEEGIVKTDWVEREVGRETFRGRVIGQLRTEGYQVHLDVRHEKQKKLADLRTTVGGPAAQWREWSGDPELARAVVRSVEEAVGEAPEPVPISQIGAAARTAPVVVRQVECIVTPDVAERVNELKLRRRDLVREVRAVDQRIADLVVQDRVQELRDELEQLKARKIALERQVVDVDKEILGLVLSS